MSPVEPEYWAVIPATGIGQRMQADRPKQYLQLGDKTILEHTLERILSYPKIQGAVVVLHEHDNYWTGLEFEPTKTVLTCHGGAERHHSVYNGLQLLEKHCSESCVVLIHDAVRPFVMHQDLDRLLSVQNLAEDGAILAVPVADTLKLADPNQRILSTRSRDGLWRAFTPQAFRLDLIKSALEDVIRQDLDITDDASAMELAGFKPRLVIGDSYNIKITQPQDLRLAELLLGMKHDQ
jgi:2-C-methyl-D-erythritol 4-phosphate cytidylyltransferase